MYLQTERMVMKTIPGQQRNTYCYCNFSTASENNLSVVLATHDLKVL